MKRGAFTLVEIIVVVAIIAIICSIAIPDLLKARMAANETATISRMRTIIGAATNFAVVDSTRLFPASFVAMAKPASGPAFLDPSFTDPTTRDGYTLTYTRTVDSLGCHVFATPTSGVTGSRDFYIDQTGIVCARNPKTGVNPGHSAGTCSSGFSEVK